jgi:hypothetical protein
MNKSATILLPNSVARGGTQWDGRSGSAEFAKQSNTREDRTEREGTANTELGNRCSIRLSYGTAEIPQNGANT